MKAATAEQSLNLLRGIVLTAAIYIYFLIFAQFAFLRLVEAAGIQGTSVRLVMAPMAIAGLLGSLIVARCLRKKTARVLLRVGLAGCATAAALALVVKGSVALMAISALVGGSLAVTTVSLAAKLPQLLPPSRLGLSLGFGTGLAYAVCNIPVVFAGSPAHQCYLAIGACVVAFLIALQGPQHSELASPAVAKIGSVVPVRVLLGVFLALVWLDSAAFFILQNTPALNRFGWADAGLQWSNAGIHLVAALAAGYCLDRGAQVFVVGAAYACLAMAALLASADTGIAQLMHWFYACGVSLYSTALVFAPLHGLAADDGETAARRAGLLYGVAGWCGSTLGIGMAQDLHEIPKWFTVAAGIVLIAHWVWYRKLAARAVLNSSIAATALALLIIAGSKHRVEAKQDVGPMVNAGVSVLAGREVYIREGCIHCHSQYVRPGTSDVVWWGPPADPILTLQQAPPIIGNRRQGPDLMNVGNRRSAAWNRIHLTDPRALVPDSRMPSYAYLFRGDGRGEALVAYLSTLGADTIGQRMTARATWKMINDAGLVTEQRAAELFQTNCAACHGRLGTGDGPQAGKLGERTPRDLTRAQWQFIPPRENPSDRLQEIARVIKFGIPTTSMPGHETMSDSEVLNLARYIESLHKADHPL